MADPAPWFVKWTYRWENFQIFINLGYIIAVLLILIHLLEDMK